MTAIKILIALTAAFEFPDGKPFIQYSVANKGSTAIYIFDKAFSGKSAELSVREGSLLPSIEGDTFVLSSKLTPFPKQMRLPPSAVVMGTRIEPGKSLKGTLKGLMKVPPVAKKVVFELGYVVDSKTWNAKPTKLQDVYELPAAAVDEQKIVKTKPQKLP